MCSASPTPHYAALVLGHIEGLARRYAPFGLRAGMRSGKGGGGLKDARVAFATFEIFN